jgi:chemotaxis protein methyltransferase CheR
VHNIVISDENINKLIGDLHEIHGYDFTSYSRASFVRRIIRILRMDKFADCDSLILKVRTNEVYARRVVEQITVNVTEMFRDPHFFKVLRNDVIPALATQPIIRIWMAGCASGEEVYSIAILLHEAGLLQKALLYATDLNPTVLDKVKKGIFSISNMKQYSENYIASGGKEDFSKYYTAMYDKVKFDNLLSSKIIVSTHNLVCDGSFNEFQLIVCRNVLIYFEKDLQDKVLRLFDDSLEPLGYLALGTKENIRFSPVNYKLRQFDNREKIWRKIM